MSAHGTVVRYDHYGCRCSECREAVRIKRITRLELAAANGGTYPGPITHGASGYQNYGCRCDECRAGHNASKAAAYSRRNAATAANGGIAPTDTHGISTYNNWGCRCDVCCADALAYWAELRARRKARAG